MVKPFSGMDLRSTRSVGQRILLESGNAGDTGTPEDLHLFRAANFVRRMHAKKTLRPTCGPRNADLDCSPRRAGCFIADGNGAPGGSETRWVEELLRGCHFAAVNAQQAVATGKERRSQSVRMPPGGCQRIENGLARSGIAGLLCFCFERRFTRRRGGAESSIAATIGTS
jgi:hypothetical protein